MKTNIISTAMPVIEFKQATNLIMGDGNIDIKSITLKPFFNKIAELGIASHLTQGQDLDWWELKRPGHPSEIVDKIINIY